MGQNSPTAEATCISWRAPRLFEQIKRTEKMSAYKPSTLLDWEAGKPLEINRFGVSRWAALPLPAQTRRDLKWSMRCSKRLDAKRARLKKETS